ncbi:NAD-dependent protein deacylase [Sphingomonas changbaiensis NBRC 104936]|uniref:NAD-dependent protein deacylase n=1 Tax=Sphingomonas changbaiensis NBRC 104936 TaxID=1219043 RepID=A0A0E9MMP3_9SPHN|nr:NAD-dependent deacylase [Sphingomonas changbaiensis]GAO38788.1 NAD-dependent protein deacylase [Sphingomonas changbaiensis NBRC 104936]
MRRIETIVVLTGAGVSAESGLATFRGPDGLWEGHRVEEVCTPQALARDPALVHAFYDARRARLAEVEPNAAHKALARLDAAWPGELLIVTQNVDDLHERAGAKRLLHMHGELKSALCAGCEARMPWDRPMSPNSVRFERSRETTSPSARFSTSLEANGDFTAPECPRCGAAKLRPDIVFFGEMPYQMDRIDAALSRADLFVSIGTSGAVYPAAGFVQTARHCGAWALELNLEPSAGSYLFSESRMGPAGEQVPAWVDEVLKR